ncbi:unnamed protein product [Cylindrotheca closterium]|uniref:Origin recognition complex subunit 2 n=1 Tax=Cylindrotheca closterium TaxID=2856 RepID=A0AAD2FH52_9STRA|nr:unnamed protein product [Cylindrotheca closterium]
MQEVMEKWFQEASSEQCDAMLALQLDYRFEGDVFASLWWSHFQKIGFRHTGTSYEVPASFPYSQKEYVANEMYCILDNLAVPQLVSSFQHDNGNRSSVLLPINLEKMSLEEMDWWKRIRRQLIFAKFHSNIDKQYKNQQSDEGEEMGDDGQPIASRRRTRSANRRSGPSGDTNPKGNCRRSFVTDAGADLYIRKKKRAKTKGKGKSKSTSERDDEPVFPTIDQYIVYAKDYHNADLEVVEESIAQTFDEWRFLLSTNQSLLLYGVGSKRSLLNKFISVQLQQDGDVIEINGFDYSVTIEGVLDLLVRLLLKNHEPRLDLHDISLFKNNGGITNGLTYARQGDAVIVQRAIAIGKALSRRVVDTLKPIYLVVHSIDGVGLRNSTAQEALAALVYHSRTFEFGQNAVRLAASVDHINGPMMLWDPTLQATFQWARRRTPTLRPYTNEIVKNDLYDNQRATKGGKNGAKTVLELEQQQLLQKTDVESIFDILASFAPRLTQSLQLLIQLQLEKKVDWIGYTDLFEQCKQSFTVSSDHQLRNWMGELIDHNVVVVDNSQRPPRYRVPYSTTALRKILKFKHKKHQLG